MIEKNHKLDMKINCSWREVTLNYNLGDDVEQLCYMIIFMVNLNQSDSEIISHFL